MQVQITARHCEISDELRSRAEEVLGRLATLVNRPVEGLVLFDRAPAGATAEIRLHGSRGREFIATGEGRDHRTALDRAEEKLRRQAVKAGPRRSRPARDAV
jgi:ribosomal subunit interface protein